MSDFKTTPIKNSYELMIDRLKAVISDKDAELARLKAEVESLKWWQGHGQKLRNAIFTHLMDLPGKSVFEVPTSDDDVEAQPEKTAKELARLKADYAICREEYATIQHHKEVLLEREARLKAENEQLVKWVDDLQSGMYINCVYCGHCYGPQDKVPCSMAEALKKHIEQCPKHPMSASTTPAGGAGEGMTRWIGLKEATRYARIGKDRLNASLAAQGNELDALRKVVWWLEPVACRNTYP